VRYVTVNKEIANIRNLSVDYGALLIGVSGQSPVVSGSPADKAGLKSGDIILELNGDRVDENHPLASLIPKYQPNEEITLKILRDGEEETIKLKLGSTE